LGRLGVGDRVERGSRETVGHGRVGGEGRVQNADPFYVTGMSGVCHSSPAIRPLSLQGGGFPPMSAAAEPLPFAEEIAHRTPMIENVRGRLGWWPLNLIRARVERPWKRRLAKAALLVPKVRHWERRHLKLSDDELLDRSMALRGKARGKWDLDSLLPEAFGLVSVAIQRTLGIRPFDVQIAAGMVMHFGGLVELATGEGKTVSASAPAYLNALSGKGVHVTTVNDYLAKRDAEWIGPVY